MFNNMSLKQKVLTGGLIPLVCIGVINIIGLMNFNEVIDSHKWVSHTHETIEEGSALEKAALDMETGLRGYLITGEDVFLEPYIQGEKDIVRIAQHLKEESLDNESKGYIIKADEIITKWEAEVANKYIELRKELDNSPQTLMTMSELVAQQKGKTYFDAFRTEMKKFKERETTLLTQLNDKSLAVTKITNNIIIFGTLAALLLALFITIFIVKKITDPILMIKEAALKISRGETDVVIDVNSNDELSEMAEAFKVMIKSLNDISLVAYKIGQGDLDVDIKQRSEKDELSKSLANMITNLNMIMSQIQEGTLALNSAANEIFATTAQVSSGASQTSAALTETSSSIEEIKQTAQKSSSKAMQTSENASQTLESAKVGSDELLNNMKGLIQIKEKMDLIASNIIKLSEQSQMISEIITTVEDIANQSNLLAVNASIEAVKAGEHGKGFSVVSQELKNLAEQSKQGTKQVQKIIFDIQKVTGTLVMVAEQGGKAVESGVQQAQNAKTSMDQVNAVILNSTNTSKQIVASYNQELAGMEQISSAMKSIQTATMQNLSSIKQVEASAKNLNTLSHSLKEVLDHYTIIKQ